MASTSKAQTGKGNRFPAIRLQSDHHQPLFLQFADALRQLVTSGALQKGEQLPPLKQLADLAQVSIYTADRGIQGLIREGILVRRPKKGTYVRGTGTPTFAIRKVILCVHQASEVCLMPNCYRGLIGLGIQGAAAGTGADLVMTSHEVLGENIHFYQNQSGFELLGVVFSDYHEERLNPLIQQYAETRFVLANARVRDFDLTMPNLKGVFFDDFGGAYELASWAYRKVRGRTAIFSRQVNNENYHQRVEGFLAAGRDHGIAPGSADLFDDRTTEGNLALGQHYLKRLLASGAPLPALILCVNDELARGAMLALDQANRKTAPLLTGFDGLQLPASPRGAFATVEVDFLRIGVRSVEVLIRPDFALLPKAIAVPGKMIPDASSLQETVLTR